MISLRKSLKVLGCVLLSVVSLSRPDQLNGQQTDAFGGTPAGPPSGNDRVAGTGPISSIEQRTRQLPAQLHQGQDSSYGAGASASQNTGTIQIKDPAEFDAYVKFSAQTEPRAKVAAGEQFLAQYPQSVVRSAILDALIDSYQQLHDSDRILSTASRTRQIDPNNMKAILMSVYAEKTQCAQSVNSTGVSNDPRTCDDAAELASEGLQVAKPNAMSADFWAREIAVSDPLFYSALALDDTVVKRDYRSAQNEYESELRLYSDDQSKTAGLNDTLLLAQAYSQPGATQDLLKAVWLYARVWDFAPANYKGQIEPKLEYYYKMYHGGLDGLDGIKQQARVSVLPPQTFSIAKAKSPQEQIRDLIAMTQDVRNLDLKDQETILAFGYKDDADKLWALVQGRQTPVAGIVIDATNTTIKVAVTQDAKDSKTADFIVNLKKPLNHEELKLYRSGFEFKTQPGAELDGTYDTYTQIPSSDSTTQRAEVVLKDGFVQPLSGSNATRDSSTSKKAHDPCSTGKVLLWGALAGFSRVPAGSATLPPGCAEAMNADASPASADADASASADSASASTAAIAPASYDSGSSPVGTTAQDGWQNGTGSGTRFTRGLPQCTRTQYQAQGASLWILNSCNVPVTVEWTSDSGNTWGQTDVIAGGKAEVTMIGIGYDPRKDGSVYLFTCPQGSQPVMPNGSPALARTYKGQFTCSLPIGR